MRTVIYLRVSTDEQAASGLGLEAQEARCRAYCLANDLLDPLIVTDGGYSGGTLDRPGWQRVAGMIAAGECGAVVVAKLDRLTRRIRHLLDLADVFRESGCALHSVSERIDTASAMGRFFFGLLGLIAEWERDTTAERTRHAKAAARARGSYCGGRVPTGRTVGQDGKLVNSGAVSLARRLRGEGLSLRKVGLELSRAGHVAPSGLVYSASSVARMCNED